MCHRTGWELCCHIAWKTLKRGQSYAPRSLSAAEKNYAQIEKEGLSVIFGLQKFHKYLYGRHFTIYADHKPLVGLLREGVLISPMACARLQRWELKLANYEYCLQYRPGSKLPDADCLSRLPIQAGYEQPDETQEVILSLNTLEHTIVTAAKISFCGH